MIPAKPLDHAISNIIYRLGKYYVRIDLNPLPKVRVCRDIFPTLPLPRDPYVINEWPLMRISLSSWILDTKDRQYTYIHSNRNNL